MNDILLNLSDPDTVKAVTGLAELHRAELEEAGITFPLNLSTEEDIKAVFTELQSIYAVNKSADFLFH